MNQLSSKEILDNCDTFVKSGEYASAGARQCCEEVVGQVSRIYGKNYRIEEVEPVISGLLLQMAHAIHKRAFEAGQEVEPLPDERRVVNQRMTWNGVPVWVDGVVTTAPENWPLIDERTCTHSVQVAEQSQAAV